MGDGQGESAVRFVQRRSTWSEKCLKDQEANQLVLLHGHRGAGSDGTPKKHSGGRKSGARSQNILDPELWAWCHSRRLLPTSRVGANHLREPLQQRQSVLAVGPNHVVQRTQSGAPPKPASHENKQ